MNKRVTKADSKSEPPSSAKTKSYVPEALPERPLAAWFLGPKAENADVWTDLLSYIAQDYIHWRRNYFPGDPIVISRTRRRTHEAWADRLSSHIEQLLNSLKADFPFYSPRYLAHMLSDQTLPSVLGYFAGMLFNPNNVTDEAAPVTVALELEVGRMVANMLGYNPNRSFAHICSGGTIANVEALWAARTVQFVPLAVHEYCSSRRFDFEVSLGGELRGRLVDMNCDELLALRPNEAIFMPRHLVRYLVRKGWSPQKAVDDVTAALRASRFNVARRGLLAVTRDVQRHPVLLVSAAAHYSIVKAANVLGYGADAVRSVPVTDSFRLSVPALADAVRSMRPDEYIAAVIAIVGTTEEGAVDPVHEVHFLRESRWKEARRSFWLHVDAAWGGYVRAIFCGDALEPKKRKKRRLVRDDLRELCTLYIRQIAADEVVKIETGREVSNRAVREVRSSTVAWSDPDVYAAYLAIGAADSVTVDPHKMGYVPYPAGVVAFQKGVVTEILGQRAQYISDIKGESVSLDEPGPIDAVGPYILEGSKPGAAAAACWLAHKTIPLTSDGHGKIIRTSVLNARRLEKYFDLHRHMFYGLDAQLFGDVARRPFTFLSLHRPDTNVLCFVTVPRVWQRIPVRRKRGATSKNERVLGPLAVPLEIINELNRRVYRAASIPAAPNDPRFPYEQQYFVSRTEFMESQYSAGMLEGILHRLGVDAAEYSAHGLFVLRATVMNPFHYLARQEGKDYLLGFLHFLHARSRETVESMVGEGLL